MLVELLTPAGLFFYGAKHMNAHRDVLPVLSEALSLLPSIEAGKQQVTVDLGRPAGLQPVVPTEDGDDIRYLRRAGRHGVSRFVIGRSAIPTSLVTVVLHRENHFGKPAIRIITGYFGAPSHREPEDTTFENEQLRTDAIAFWAKHAFAYDPALVAYPL